LISQKNQFSEVDEWDEPEEVIRVYSKEEIVALQQSDATKYRALSPWKIILAQVLITAISMVIWSIFGEPAGVTVYTQSAFLGGLISVLPTALFLIRLELAKKTQRLNPERFLAALVSGEFIKIAVTVMLFIGIA
jgi:ATP synthase protein I